MSYILSELKEPIIIIATSQSEWATLQNIMVLNGRNPWGAFNKETFETHPFVVCYPKSKTEYINVRSDHSAMRELINVPASVFIADNDFQPHSANA